MNRSLSIYFAVLIFLFVGCTEAPKESANNSPASYVNPFIGTGGHGHTYPGAARPFGMVQLSPDTRLDGWDGCSGYHFTDSVVYGFSHTHLSGTGVSDYGDVLLMPVVGYDGFDNGAEKGVDNGYSSRFDKSTEKAEAGFYQVFLKDYGIGVELTSTERTGFHRYTFPAAEAARIIIDLAHRDKVIDAHLEKSAENEVVGYRISDAWAKEQHVYFVAQFSKPFESLEIDSAIAIDVNDGPSTVAMKGALTFKTEENETILVKVGISPVSIEGARKNLEAEVVNKDFDQVRDESIASWNKALNKISVAGGTPEQQTIFYTSLYHALLNPNLYSDVDGQYRGMDGEVHSAGDSKHYTVFSLWDTFRAAHPLFTITEQEKTNEFIQTFIRQYDDGGVLPIWELAGNYTGCMIGYHAIPVIADAYQKGIRDYDVEKIYQAMRHSAMLDQLGLDSYKALGYIPADHESESVSKTLEYAYDDWCIAQVAQALGKEDDYQTFMERSQFYKNIFDPQTGFMRAKLNNNWWQPFDPTEVNFNYTEANSWQYSLFAPHDVDGLAELLGGKAALEEQLDRLFTTSSETSGRHQADITGLVGQYAHGNEPSHHMAYLYNYTGSPWKTQKWVRQIMDELYTDQPDGLCGNEDCGQMSAWYVLSAMGFYPVCPGSDEYVMGTPIFPEVNLNLENGNSFRILANGVSDQNTYVQSVQLNGKEYGNSYIHHGDLMAGGELVFEMGPEPNKAFAAAESNRPHSGAKENKLTPVPYFLSSGKTFTGSMEMEIASSNENLAIHYTIDGSEPNPTSPVYAEKISLTESAVVKALSIDESGNKSRMIEAEFIKVKGGRSVTLHSKFANEYTGGGEQALIDYQRGGNNFKTGVWQGYRADLNVVVALDETQTIQKISTGFLQDIGSWIWFPTEVEYAVSTDGENFEVIATVKNEVSDKDYEASIQDLTTEFSPRHVKYVRVKAKNYGICPDWHLGAGGDTWVFVDEIVLQ